jgi:NAD-dependent DNA ligase
VPLARLITGLSIPHVGEETAILLAEHFKTIDDIAFASEEELQNLEGYWRYCWASSSKLGLVRKKIKN